MSRYAKIMNNDIIDGSNVCVSFWVQGCPLHCKGCHNPSTWNFQEGLEYTDHTKWEIIEAIGANGIQRNFSVLGGEPFALQNIDMTEEVISAVRQAYPNIKIFVWTGYTKEELAQRYFIQLEHILGMIDVLIDGPFIQEQRNLDLKLRGSENQRVWVKENNKWKIIE